MLNTIAHLKENWNENNAHAFPTDLIEKCSDIINELEVQPFIAPTACGAIQMEYEKENGDYLEFEIYLERIEVYQVINKVEHEETLKGNDYLNSMKQIISNFLTDYIKIKDITDTAITEEQGLQLRKEIEKVIGNSNKIILDFDGIKIFTTTFFSASIGYYILKLSPKKCRDIFVLKNISKTGKNAYQFSIDNAEEVYFLTGL